MSETRTIREEIPGMRKMRIIIPIAIAVVAVTVFSLTVVLAQENERGDSNASRLAGKVAKILGLDAAEVDDAINQARRELRNEAGQGKKTSREDSRRIAVEDVEARLKAAVKEGKITQGQADARLEGFKARAEGIKRGDGSFDVAGAVSRAKVSLEKGETTLDALEARLQSAVKGGRLTQDDADAIMKRLKQ